MEYVAVGPLGAPRLAIYPGGYGERPLNQASGGRSELPRAQVAEVVEVV